MAEPGSPGQVTDSAPGKAAELDRLRSFSDGVFSIAATLLFLQLRPPALHASAGLLAGLLREWPQLVAYAGAFLAIGGSWLGHRAIVAGLTRDTPAVHVVRPGADYCRRGQGSEPGAGGFRPGVGLSFRGSG